VIDQGAAMKLGWVVTAFLALVSCSAPQQKPAPPPPPSVQTSEVDYGPEQAVLLATGTLERRREMTLSFRVGGVLTRLTIDAGDSVKAGQALASIDPTGLDARYQQTLADLERARRDLARDQKLFDQGYVSRARLDDRASAVKSAQAAHKATGFDRRWAQLIAPADGVILTRLAQTGEVVQPGQAVLRLSDQSSPLVLRLAIADRDIGQVKPGQTAQVQFDSLPDRRLAGKVVKIGEAADPRTGAVQVEVELPSAPELKSGQVATASLSVDQPASRRFGRIPAEAILEAEGVRASVLILTGGRAKRTAVGFGGFDGDFARVEGLAPGARVITAGAGFVSDGALVTVANPASLEGADR